MSKACFGINDWRNAVFRSDLTCQAKCVACALASYYCPDAPCYPSQRALAQDASVTQATVCKALKALKELGFIKMKKMKVKAFSFEITEYEFSGINTDINTDINDDIADIITDIITDINDDTEKENKKTSNKKNIINNKKNSKDKTKKFQPPTLEEVRSYAMDRDREDLADKFFEYYNEGGWCDNQGKKLANWKQKFIRWEDWNPVKDDDDSGYVPGAIDKIFS